jgi:hypothetical protein
MAEVVQDAPQEFWRPLTVNQQVAEETIPAAAPAMADACPRCGIEFMIGARFCHACGVRRLAQKLSVNTEVNALAEFWETKVDWVRSVAAGFSWNRVPFPQWMRYLHFHEIKRRVGLSTAALVAFIIGLGCVAGAIGVSLFYRASNLAEFQAIQMWRIEWLLAATASFVAGILLKKPSDTDGE